MSTMDEIRSRITYRREGDYWIPDLEMPPQKEYELGHYARARKKYLKEHHPGLYTNLLTECKLNEHLYETEQRALDMEDRLTEQMKEREGITEQLKASDMMAWVRAMNSITNRVREIVMEEVIYA